MIVSGIMDAIKSIILFFIGLFPTLPDLHGLEPTIDVLFGLYENVNSLIDVRICCVCILALIVVYNARFIWAVVMWIVRKIPGVS